MRQPLPWRWCGHGRPAGFSKAAIGRSLQQRVQPPQRRGDGAASKSQVVEIASPWLVVTRRGWFMAWPPLPMSAEQADDQAADDAARREYRGERGNADEQQPPAFEPLQLPDLLGALIDVEEQQSPLGLVLLVWRRNCAGHFGSSSPAR